MIKYYNMKKLILLTLTLGLFISCETELIQIKHEPNMEFGGWSGVTE